MHRHLKVLPLLVAVVMVTVISTPAFAQTGKALGSIRLVNASPDAPTLDFYFNQQKTYSGLKFKDISTYADVAKGSYNIKVFASPSDGTGTPLFEVPGFTVNEGSMNTLVTVGMVKNKSVTLLPLTDNNLITTADSAKAKLRFIHGSPDAPAVNVEAKGLGDVFNNISFKSVGSYITAPAGSLTLNVKPVADTTKVVFTKTLSLEANKVYSIFVVGEVAGAGLDTVIAVDKAITGTPSTGQGSRSGSLDDNLWLLASLIGMAALSGLGLTRTKKKRYGKF